MLNFGSLRATVEQPAILKVREGDSIRVKPTSYVHHSQSAEEIIGSKEGIP